MVEETVKRRIRRAKERASDVLVKTGYRIVPSDNSEFCILAIRKKEIRMIRVVIDEITGHDIDLIKDFEPPGICTKEIWCKSTNSPDFDIKEVF